MIRRCLYEYHKHAGVSDSPPEMNGGLESNRTPATKREISKCGIWNAAAFEPRSTL